MRVSSAGIQALLHITDELRWVCKSQTSHDINGDRQRLDLGKSRLKILVNLLQPGRRLHVVASADIDAMKGIRRVNLDGVLLGRSQFRTRIVVRQGRVFLPFGSTTPELVRRGQLRRELIVEIIDNVVQLVNVAAPGTGVDSSLDLRFQAVVMLEVVCCLAKLLQFLPDDGLGPNSVFVMDLACGWSPRLPC